MNLEKLVHRIVVKECGFCERDTQHFINGKLLKGQERYNPLFRMYKNYYVVTCLRCHNTYAVKELQLMAGIKDIVEEENDN